MTSNSSASVSLNQRVEAFEFTERHFEDLRALVHDLTGISMSNQKKDLLYGRLSRRLRALNLSGFDEYYALLKKNPEKELQSFINAVTTNLTSFFRESHHFSYLEQELIPTLTRENRLRGLRIWSAGCSTGEEPYSIAITLRENIPNIDTLDIKILASDLDTNVVATAEKGVYDHTRIDGIDPELAKRWFQKGTGNNSGKVRVRQELRDMVTFKSLNLLQPWPMTGKFDLVFCRNVVIYFDKDTQITLFDRFADILKPRSHLIIGHSESLHKLSERFKLIGKTIYVRTS